MEGKNRELLVLYRRLTALMKDAEDKSLSDEIRKVAVEDARMAAARIEAIRATQTEREVSIRASTKLGLLSLKTRLEKRARRGRSGT